MKLKRSRFVTPNSRQIQVDLDSAEQLAICQDQFRILLASKVWKVVKFTLTPSAATGHWHVTVEFSESMTDME